MIRQYTAVSIILPAINETYSFRQTVDVIINTCNREDIHELIIVLCKKSTPDCVRTAEEIQKHCTDIPVRIYYQKKPFIGSAMREAFDLAQGSHIIMMSADLETDPHLICNFIQSAKQHPEAVITASRWLKNGDFSGYNGVKLVSNFIFQRLIACMFQTKLSDMTYAYRIFPAHTVKNIRWEETKHPFFLETALKPLRTGVQFKEIPARWQARTEGESQNSFFKNFDYFRVAFKIRFMKRSSILKHQ